MRVLKAVFMSAIFCFGVESKILPQSYKSEPEGYRTAKVSYYPGRSTPCRLSSGKVLHHVVGVASNKLPKGTKLLFKHKNTKVIAYVNDRGRFRDVDFDASVKLIKLLGLNLKLGRYKLDYKILKGAST